MAASGATSELYRAVIGGSWDRLDPGVVRLHGRNGAVQSGTFRVRRGTGRMARLVASLLRFPPEGDLVSLSLKIMSRGRREMWRRLFGRTPMVTEQYERDGSVLVECMGPLALHFRLDIDGGALVFRLIEVRLFGLPLPRALRPRVSGREWGTDRTQVAIRAEAPWLGLLLSYEGVLE